MTAPVMCRHCGREIEVDSNVGVGWRHIPPWFVSCHPGRPGTTLAEPVTEEVPV